MAGCRDEIRGHLATLGYDTIAGWAGVAGAVVAELTRRHGATGTPHIEEVQDLVERMLGDLEPEQPHQMVIGRCDRCGTVIEPRLSVQWFIHVKPLAERALASVREGRTRILPEHHAKVFAHWMENIHDWAVGRQLWWGHRIPAWYCRDCGHQFEWLVRGDEKPLCPSCGRSLRTARPASRSM